MARILIVGDDRTIRLLVKRVLEMDGHEVTEAVGSEQGFQTYQDVLVDLVVADFKTTQRAGLEQIRKLYLNNPELKVIVLCGGDQESIVSAIRAGARHIVVKPFDIGEFSRIVTKALAKSWKPSIYTFESREKLRAVLNECGIGAAGRTPRSIRVKGNPPHICWN